MPLSSASRRLASLLTAASLRRSECSNTLVHNDFYFGPWSGLHYPYTPLRLEPILVIHPLQDPNPRGSSAPRAPRGGELRLDGRRLPPLRAAMAELARSLNEHAWAPLTYPGSGEGMRCGRLKVRVDGVDRGEADLCSPDQMEVLAQRLSTILHNYIETLEGYPLRSVLAWVGLANLKADTGEGDEFLASLVRRQGVIADTSLVYYGLHRYYWEGASVDIPDCVLREVHRRLAESLKRGRARDARGMADILAYLGLKDMLWRRPPIVPSPPGDCDTAVPKIDPVILNDKMVATADDGAYRYWKLHPSSRLARPVKVFFTPEEKPNFEAGDGRVRISRLYYSVYQALIVLKLMESQGIGVDSIDISVRTGDGEKPVKPPISMLLGALNLKERSQRG
ncbi:MAG: hypothetical protein GSR84_00865 [Desulfurococcales archaeon]|nr:hypothetical protein [Desulfurococcales archaeon]